MKLRHVELINAMLEVGTLSAAARLLNITQPVATRTLQHAEQSLGYALFTRRGGRLQPTEELVLLTPVIRQAFDGLEEARRTAINLRSRQGGTLRVGIALSLAQPLPKAYELMQLAQEGLRCEFSTGHYSTLQQWLLMHEIDVAICLEAPLHPALDRIDLVPRRLVCAARPEVLGKHCDQATISAQSMRTMPLIEIINTDPVGRMVATYAERYEWPYPAAIAVKTHQVALDFAARGMGVAVVDDLSAARYAQALTILPIEPAATVGMHALTLQSRGRTVVIDRFIDAFRLAIAG